MDKKAARRVLEELERRAKVKGNLRPEGILFGPQLAFAQATGKRRAAVCSRRAGKTFSIAFLLLEAAMKHPKSFGVYVTMSRALAKNIIWPAFVAINDKFSLGLEFKQNTGDVVLPNGSRILLRGAGSVREIDKLRGLKYPVAVIDEAQGFGDELQYMLNEVLAPATMDYDGTILVTGTPNASCSGPFYDLTHNTSLGWDVHHWTMLENPHLPDPVSWLENERRMRGMTLDTPAYLREYCGKWVRDSESLVYSIDYGRNVYQSFPKDAVGDWLYVLGIDVGYNDPTAFSVMAYSMELRETWVLESYKKPKLIPSVAAAHVEALRARFPFTKIVVDTGGLGKGYAEEWKQKFGIPVEAAKKTDKLAYIELMNSDLRTGTLKIVGPTNKDLVEEMTRLQWDTTKVENGKFVIDSNFQDHLCDATLYGWRFCLPHAHQATENPEKHGTPAWLRAQENKIIQSAKDRLSRSEIPWWKKLGGREGF